MIYLDNAATTPIREEVLDAMMPYLMDQFGNAGAIYQLGRDARKAVERAREQVAAFFNAKDVNQIVFTSGGSEANTLAILGSALRRHTECDWWNGIARSDMEHDSVLTAFQRASDVTGERIHEISSSRVLRGGCELLGDRHYNFVSVMRANNEMPVRFNVESIADVVHYHGGLFHTDCVQAASQEVLDVQRWDCDFASISGHKINAPKGIGALYVKDPDSIVSIVCGSSQQEYGLRGGTENVASIVGFGKACEISQQEKQESLDDYLLSLITAFQETMFEELHGTYWYNMWYDSEVTKTLSITIEGVDAQTLILALSKEGIYISAGSACHGSSTQPSRVLKAWGLTDEEALNTIRVSFPCYGMTPEDAVTAARKIAEIVRVLRC